MHVKNVLSFLCAQARVEEMSEETRSLRAEVDKLTDSLLDEERKVGYMSIWSRKSGNLYS